VLVSAADEERVIAKRIENLLGQEAPGPYRSSSAATVRATMARRAREAGEAAAP
jgi:hypothetical protein